MKALVGAFNHKKALVGAFSVITNLRMELFEALLQDHAPGRLPPPRRTLPALVPHPRVPALAPGQGATIALHI